MSPFCRGQQVGLVPAATNESQLNATVLTRGAMHGISQSALMGGLAAPPGACPLVPRVSTSSMGGTQSAALSSTKMIYRSTDHDASTTPAACGLRD